MSLREDAGGRSIACGVAAVQLGLDGLLLKGWDGQFPGDPGSGTVLEMASAFGAWGYELSEGLVRLLTANGEDGRPRHAVHLPAGRLSIAIETLAMPTLQSYRGRYRPVQPGSSVAPRGEAGGPGTVTAIVRKRYGDGCRYLLSCEHVLAPRRDSSGKTVSQPAASDFGYGGRSDDVGKVVEAVGLRSTGANRVDAALASLDSAAGSNRCLSEHASLAVGRSKPDLNHPVRLIGRSSGASRGKIECTKGSALFRSGDLGSREVLMFQDPVRTSYRCEGGDSGGPVIDERTGELVGMHIAGSEGAGYFCRISEVFEALSVTLV